MKGAAMMQSDVNQSRLPSGNRLTAVGGARSQRVREMRVLLIEDDSAMERSIELMLRSEGFNVYTTDLGEEGIDLGKIYDYDLILLDLNLPDMSGMDVLRTLRVGKINTPIMILSGTAEIDTKVKTFSGGA